MKRTMGQDGVFTHFHVNDTFMIEGILTIDKARGFPLLLEGLASFKVHVTGVIESTGSSSRITGQQGGKQ